MPYIYSNLEYYDMLKCFYKSEKSTFKASRLYFQRFPERKQPSRATFSSVEKKLQNTGKIFNLFKYIHKHLHVLYEHKIH